MGRHGRSGFAVQARPLSKDRLPSPARPPKQAPDWTREQISDLSEAVYRIRLGSPAAVADMISNDKDQGQKLRNRSRCYHVMTRAYLDVLKERGMLKTD